MRRKTNPLLLMIGIQEHSRPLFVVTTVLVGEKTQTNNPRLFLFGLRSKGFIAGVTNQLFEDRTAWWDILCNIDTGKITVSKDITPLPASSQNSAFYDDTRPLGLFTAGQSGQAGGKYDNGDNEFMADVRLHVFYLRPFLLGTSS